MEKQSGIEKKDVRVCYRCLRTGLDSLGDVNDRRLIGSASQLRTRRVSVFLLQRGVYPETPSLTDRECQLLLAGGRSGRGSRQAMRADSLGPPVAQGSMAGRPAVRPSARPCDDSNPGSSTSMAVCSCLTSRKDDTIALVEGPSSSSSPTDEADDRPRYPYANLLV